MESTERTASLALEILAAEYECGPGVNRERPSRDLADAIRYGLIPEKQNWRGF